MNLILKAATLAERMHRGQTRKYTGTPYIWHPMRVAGRASILRHSTEEMVAAAWLHDTIEDCGATAGMIEEHFGPLVRKFVMELTNPSKGRKDLKRAERKAMDRQHIAIATREARTIKLLDRIDNLREMMGAEPDFLMLYREESKLLLAALEGTDADLEDELRCEYVDLGKLVERS